MALLHSVHDARVTLDVKMVVIDGFCISRSRDICVNGIHRHMKVVEHSSGGISLMIKKVI